MLRTIDSRIKIESNINIKITIHMTSKIVDKINELIDKINELDVKVNKLYDILKYSDNVNVEINNNKK